MENKRKWKEEIAREKELFINTLKRIMRNRKSRDQNIDDMIGVETVAALLNFVSPSSSPCVVAAADTHSHIQYNDYRKHSLSQKPSTNFLVNFWEQN